MDDKKIINAIRAGDSQSMELLMDKYSRLLWTIAGAILKNSASTEDVEECVSDVFLHLWLHPDKFDSKRGNLKGYLALLTKSKAIDKLRQNKREAAIPLDEDIILKSEDILENLIDKEDKAQLMDTIRALKEPNKEILIRRFFFEQKPSEIARALSLSVRQVENRIYRTKQQLRQIPSLNRGV